MKQLSFTVQQMRALLTAHDTLASDDARAREEAERRIDDLADQAAARCEELRDQLARAREFARQLAAHAPTAHGPAAGGLDAGAGRARQQD